MGSLCLKHRFNNKKRIHPAALPSLLGLMAAGAAMAQNAPDLPGAVIRLEAGASVEAGLVAEHVATCNTQDCFDNDFEDALARRSFCDTAPVALSGAEGSCPGPATVWDEVADSTGFAAYGCARFALDPAGPTPWQMDDSQKLCLYKSCAGGRPCFAGHGQVFSAGSVWVQGATLELPASSARTVDPGADFHLFAVLEAAPSTRRECVLGNALHHLCVEPDGALFLRLGAYSVELAGAGAVPLGSWALLELKRQSGALSVSLDGTDVTVGAPFEVSEPFVVSYFMSSFKGADAFTGRVSGLWLYDHVLSAVEASDMHAYLASTYEVGADVAVGRLRFDASPDRFVVQRTYDAVSDAWTADRTVSGTWISSNITGTASIEARVVDAETLAPVTAWTAVATVDAAQGPAWSGVLPDVPQGGWYRVEARLSAAPSIAALSRERFGVGMVVAAIGQSNMVKLFTEDPSDGSIPAPFETPDELTWRYGYGEPEGYAYARPRTAEIPVGWGPVTGSGGIRLGNNLAQRLGIPVLILDFSLDWTGLLQHWNDDTFVGWTRFAAALDEMTGLEAVIWHQGAFDAHEPYAYANDVVTVGEHKAGLDALYAAITTRRPESVDGGPMPFLVAIQNRGVYDDVLVKDDAYNAVRRAQLEWIAENPHAFSAGSSLDLDLSTQPWAGSGHFWAADYQVLADRYSRALLHAVETPAGAEDWTLGVDGPRLVGATLQGRTITLEVAHDGGSRLRLQDPEAAVEGFTVTDGDWVVDDGSGPQRHELPLVAARLSDDGAGNWIELELAVDPVGPVKIRYLYGQNVFHYRADDASRRRNGNTVYDDFEVLEGAELGLPLLPTTEDLVAVSAFELVTDQQALSVAEDTAATFQVHLGGVPTSDVVVDLEILGDADFSFGAAPSGPRSTTLLFTPQDAATPQSVTVYAVGDADAEIGTAVVRLSAPGYQSRTVELFELDADPYLALEETDLAVSRLGGTDTFRVALGVPPVSPVTLRLTSLDPAWISVSPATLTFDAADWNVARTVTVTGQDAGGSPPVPARLELSIDVAASDELYDPLLPVSLDVTVLDLSSGLAARWPLDEVLDDGLGGFLTPDLGAAGLDGVVGADVLITVGVEDGALRTVGPGGLAGDAADGVRVDAFGAGDGRELTVSLWYRPDGAKHDGYLFHWGGTYDARNALSAFLDVGTGLRIRVHDEADELSVEQIAPSGFDQNGWHHLAVVKDETGSRFYFDGAPAGTSTMGAGLLRPALGFALGMNELGTYGSELDFDDVRLYGRALAEAEIQAIYAESADVPVTVLLGPEGLPTDARWGFVEADGSVVQRASGDTVEREPGFHTVRFFAATGYLTPADRVIETVLGEPEVLTELYALPGQGALRVDLQPTAVADGAGRFFLSSDPSTLYTSGTVSTLAVGTYELGFTAVPGWITPGPVFVEVLENQTASVIGLYVDETALDPILHLPLDESSGTVATDLSGLGRHGVYGAQVVLGGAGIDGGAAQSRGPGQGAGSSAQGVVVADFPGDTYDAATVSLWYRVVDPHDGYLLTWGGSYNDPGSISAYLDVGTGLRVRVHDDGDTASVSASAPPSFDDDRWHHLVITKDAVGTVIYFDGLPHVSHAMGSGPLTPQDRLSLGMNELGTYGVTADFDDLRLWQRALSAAEVAQLFTSSAKATVRIDLEPQEARDAGARWRLDGPGGMPVGTWHLSGETAVADLDRTAGDLAAQDWTVVFDSVAGWTAPASRALSLEAGDAATTQSIYLSASAAALTVDLLPASVAPLGAWRVQGQATWLPSGHTEILQAGTYILECLDVDGYVAPALPAVTLTAGETRTVSAMYEEILRQDPILQLALDESSGSVAVDASGFGHDGVYGVAMQLGRSGVGPTGSGVAAATTGPGGTGGGWHHALAVPSFADGRSVGEATVAFWYRLDSASNDGYLFHWGGTYTDPDSLSIYLDIGTGLRIRVHDSGDTASTLQVAPEGAYGRFDDLSWHHVVVVKSAAGSAVYFDGTWVASHAMGAASMVPSGSTGLGSNELGTYGVAASFDDLRVWERALDGAEITDLFAPSAVGRLRVEAVPESLAVDAGWRLGSDAPSTVRAPGDELVLPAGVHTVAFTAVDGWTTPNDEVVGLGIGAAVTVVGDYAAGAPMPIVHWPLDTVVDGVTPDLSGFGRHGLVGSRVAIGLGGVDGGAVQTAGLGFGTGSLADGIALPLSLTAPLGELGVAFWYRLGAEPHDGYLFNWGGTHNQDNAVSVFLEVGGELRVRVREQGDHGSVIGVAPPGFDDAAWHHVAIVKNAVGSSIYFDGALVAQSVAGAGPILPVGGFILGMNEAKRYGVEAAFDDVRLYNRSLSAGEIADLVGAVTVPDGFGGAYRTVDELRADLESWAAAYPGILELVDYGDSHAKTVGGITVASGDHVPGDDLLAARVTHLGTLDPGAPRPVFVLMACLHAREIGTPELAMRYLEHLLGSYGVDADVTWLVDHHEIWILPLVNPDGHRLVEAGALDANGARPWPWRKNARQNGACPWPPTSGDTHGVDLNRNFPYQWGVLEGIGGSSDPCDAYHRGASAGSEAETQAVMSLISSLIPDQRPSPSVAAPADATGIFIQLHSPFRTVAWPWAYGYQSSPDAAGLRAIGEKMADMNGYASEQANTAIYPMSGTADDWVHGELGAPAFLIEVGEGLMPAFNRVDNMLWPENRDVFAYAAKIARTPYLTVDGPEVFGLQATATGSVFSLTATVDDGAHGTQSTASAVQRVEIYVDEPPWLPGAVAVLEALPVDGTFNQSREDVSAVLDTGGWVSGRHQLFVRSQDVGGLWGPVSSIFIDVP